MNIYVGLYHFFSILFRHTPRWLIRPFLFSLAWLYYHLDSRRRKIVAFNIDFAFGAKLPVRRKQEISHHCYRHLALNLLDFAKNQSTTKKSLLQHSRFIGTYHVDRVLAQGQTPIFFTAHYGNWEITALLIAARFTPITVVGRKLGNAKLDAILKANREQFGVHLLDKNGATRGMIASLKQNRPIGLLVDQNTKSSEGILVDFFGKKTRHITTAALLSQRFNAPLIPVFTRRLPDGSHEIQFFPPFNTKRGEAGLRNSVQKQASITERIIRAHPEQWFWPHRRWKNQYEHLYRAL